MIQFNTVGIENGIKVEVKKTLFELRNYLQSIAPVKTGRYKRSWRYNVGSGGLSGKVFNVQEYGVYIEGGFENPSNAQTKKLVFSKQKWWSRQAIGGTVDPTIGTQQLSPFADTMATRIGDVVIRSI